MKNLYLYIPYHTIPGCLGSAEVGYNSVLQLLGKGKESEPISSCGCLVLREDGEGEEGEEGGVGGEGVEEAQSSLEQVCTLRDIQN